jgi:hypothetical protein
MRSFAMLALGSFVVSTCLTAQTFTDHAAAAAGATIGTAAGKPLGTALGKIFGDVDKSTSNASGAKAKPLPPKPDLKTAEKPLATAVPSVSPLATTSGGGGNTVTGTAVVRPTARRREAPVAAEVLSIPEAPVTPFIAEPVVKEPSADEVAAVKVGETSNQLEAALGPPESRVSIPDDDGHLLEICQYWAKGQPLGTIRLDNGMVVSVQTH